MLSCRVTSYSQSCARKDHDDYGKRFRVTFLIVASLRPSRSLRLSACILLNLWFGWCDSGFATFSECSRVSLIFTNAMPRNTVEVYFSLPPLSNSLSCASYNVVRGLFRLVMAVLVTPIAKRSKVSESVPLQVCIYVKMFQLFQTFLIQWWNETL